VEFIEVRTGITHPTAENIDSLMFSTNVLFIRYVLPGVD